MSLALLIVDIQNDYLPGGAMQLEGSAEAATQAKLLLDLFRARAWPVTHIQHEALQPGATFFLPGTKGMEIAPLLTPAKGERVLRKHFPNSFRATGLHEHLQELGAQRLVICGMMTHMCVDATVRAAFDLGYECLLSHEACATRALEFAGRSIAAKDVHGAFLAALGAVYAKIYGTKELLALLEA